jgi:maleylpyruvate isomerase
VPARQDLLQDPRTREWLGRVRLGTAYFRRALNQLSDADLDAPSLLPGWSRRDVVAHVGYNARAVARLVNWAATGVETPMYASATARAAEIDLGASLSPAALRHLCEHAAIDLDVRWRDLPEPGWDAEVVTAQGRAVPASETVWMRTREVWLHAIDLDTGARLDEVPVPVLQRLLGDVVGVWTARGDTGDLGLRAHHSEGTVVLGALGAGRQVTGSLPDVVSWATGRGVSSGLEWNGGGPVVAPRWI